MEKMNDLILAAVVSGGNILVRQEGTDVFSLPTFGSLNLTVDSDESFDFRLSEPIKAFSLGEEIRIEGCEWVELRKSASLLSEQHYVAAAKARELLHWNSNSRYCQSCGAPMRRASAISKRCEKCGREIWPQISPAVIVLVKKGDEALLVHSKAFTSPFYGLVAGFVETGETLEEAVSREISEETSLEVDGIKYFASQSWPFPAQLMIGFTANYVSGDVRFADGELSSGGFFSKENLPQIPAPPSIARQMIDAWLRGEI